MHCGVFGDDTSCCVSELNRPVAAPGCETKRMGRMIEQEFESSKSSVGIRNQDVEIK